MLRADLEDVLQLRGVRSEERNVQHALSHCLLRGISIGVEALDLRNEAISMC